MHRLRFYPVVSCHLAFGLVDALPYFGRCFATVLDWLLWQVVIVDLVVIALNVTIWRPEIATVVAELFVASMLVQSHSLPSEADTTLFVVQAPQLARPVAISLISRVLVLAVVDTPASNWLPVDRWQVAPLLGLPSHVVVVARSAAVANLW